MGIKCAVESPPTTPLMSLLLSHVICYTTSYHIHYPERHLIHNHVSGPLTVCKSVTARLDLAACSAMLHFGVIYMLAWVQRAMK
eukprot:scaffold3875_cov19-Prasinocladus_malaysianus.AAC.1